MKFGPLSEDIGDSFEDVPLNFDCSGGHYVVQYVPKKPTPRLDKVKAAIKYFFSMKKEENK